MNSQAQGYPSDLTDSQWDLIQPLLPPAKKVPGGPGRPPMPWRRVVDALRYLVKTGVQWRMLPHDFGNGHTLYHYFNDWSKEGVLDRLEETWVKRERIHQGHPEEPSAGCVDSQSVETTSVGGVRGYDGGKGVKGRKRHVLADTLGLPLGVVVTPANTNDREGLKWLLLTVLVLGKRRIRKLGLDAGYAGEAVAEWAKSLVSPESIDLEIVHHTGQGFQVVPRRWVIERAFAWLDSRRRLSKDYERLMRNSEAMIQLAVVDLLIPRLA